MLMFDELMTIVLIVACGEAKTTAKDMMGTAP